MRSYLASFSIYINESTGGGATGKGVLIHVLS